VVGRSPTTQAEPIQAGAGRQCAARRVTNRALAGAGEFARRAAGGIKNTANAARQARGMAGLQARSRKTAAGRQAHACHAVRNQRGSRRCALTHPFPRR